MSDNRHAVAERVKPAALRYMVGLRWSIIHIWRRVSMDFTACGLHIVHTRDKLLGTFPG
jgi:hypothetical protein